MYFGLCLWFHGVDSTHQGRDNMAGQSRSHHFAARKQRREQDAGPEWDSDPDEASPALHLFPNGTHQALHVGAWGRGFTFQL